jgi:hypothetical protein
MTTTSTTANEAASWRQAFWLLLLIAASLAFGLGFGCAVPFAAFGAVAALTMGRWRALSLVVAIWLANQLVGFGILGYPWTADAAAWGAALGIVALLAALAAQWAVRYAGGHGAIAASAAAFGAAFVVFEGGLYLVAAALLGGTADYTNAVVTRILEINLAGFVGLLVLNRLAVAGGLVATPVPWRRPLARHA